MTKLTSLIALSLALAWPSCNCDQPPAVAEGEGEGEGAAGEGEGEGEGDAGCTTDDECGDGEVCSIAGACVSAPCASDADCPDGQSCGDGGVCEGSACTGDGDCPVGQVCDTAAGTCSQAPCTSDDQCPDGQVCGAGGSCERAACVNDSDCEGGQICDVDERCSDSPLVDPYEAFCSGSGSVVGIGGTTGGDLCLGDVVQQTFQFGFCACSDVSADGSQLLLDSFDSGLGNYDSQPHGQDGHFGANGSANMNIQMEIHGSMVVGGGGLTFPSGGNNRVIGDLYCYGDAIGESAVPVGNDAYVLGVLDNFDVARDVYISDPADVINGTVGGGITTLAIPQVAPCPCEPEQKLPIANIVAFGSTHNDNAVLDDPATSESEALAPAIWASGTVGPSTLTLPCGRFYLQGVEQDQGLTIHATGRTVLFVDGNFVANALQVQLDPGAEVDIIVSGDMHFDASSDLGNVDIPSAVRTYVNGQLTFGAQATFGGLIYAPNADVVFNARTTIYGALFVDSAALKQTEVHFDSAVRSAGDACEEPGEGEGEGEGEGTPGEGEGEGTPAEGEGEGTPAEGEGEGAGPSGCFRCDPDNQCGSQACLGDDGTGIGSCGACTNSIDCCFPLVCSAGQCILLGG